MRKRYLVYITRSDEGTVDRVYIPMRYVYVLVAAAVTGMFTIAGMAGSYTRMLAKAETINRLRDELALTRKDYAHLEKKDHEKDLQVASLGSLASEVSAIYGLTAGRLTLPHGKGFHAAKPVVDPAKAVLKDDLTTVTDDTYTKSLDTYYALEGTAMLGLATQNLDQGLDQNVGVRSSLRSFGSVDRAASSGGAGDFSVESDSDTASVPDMWPILGPINSGFGQREDPVLGMGIGEFHKGVDIGSPDGTPVHAPADGRVIKVAVEAGYGRTITVSHGNGIATLYGHLSGFHCVVGQMVTKGQVIGYVGHSGKVTGSHLHYEVQIHGTAVNPHKYLQTTMAQLGEPVAAR